MANNALNPDNQSTTMDYDETITSEVNVCVGSTNSSSTDPDGFCTSSFVFSLPQPLSGETKDPDNSNITPQFDHDGDLIVRRQDQSCDNDQTIRIKHKTTSNLSGVGQQVWRGALFMVDHLLDQPDFVRGKRVIEIGAGTGLTAIVVAKFCQPTEVLATDLPELMDLIRENCSTNGATIGTAPGKLTVHPFDVTKPMLSEGVLADFMSKADIVLGCDVIYDNDVTDGIIGFMKSVICDFKVQGMTFLFTVEKRYIFTVDDLDVVAPSYEYFLAKCTDLESDSIRVDVNITSEQDINQYFCYERSKDLVLLQINIAKKKE